MKKRDVRPEPIRVDPYFFRQLIYEREEEANSRSGSPRGGSGEDGEQEQQPQSSSCPSQFSSGGTASSILSPSWRIAPVTREAPIDEKLWVKFTPSGYRQDLVDFMGTEHRKTLEMSKELERMWDQVETVVQRNASRRAVWTAAYQEKLKELESIVFWRDVDVLQRYQLDLSLPSQMNGGAAPANGEARRDKKDAKADKSFSSGSLFTDMVDGAHITLHFDMAIGKPPIPTTPSPGTSLSAVLTEGTSALPTPMAAARQKAKAYSKTREELMNPTARPHFLRRLFSPFLQRRSELPKVMTLLLSEIQRCQSEVLPSIETAIADYTMFFIPLHLPFQIVTRYISRYLTKSSPCVALEESQKSSIMEEMIAETEELKQFVLAHEGRDEELEGLHTADRLALSREMWDKVLQQLSTHQSVHRRLRDQYTAMSQCAAQEAEKLETALDECDAMSSEAMSQLTSDAQASVEVVQGLAKKVKDAMAEVETSYTRDSSSLQESLKRKEFQLEKSEAQQERLARRVREAMKEFFTEQFKYEELAQEVLQERLALAQVETSYSQVKHAVKTCYDEAIECDTRAARLHKLLKKSEKVRAYLIKSCRQHVGRVCLDNYYRRHRIADRCSQNMQQWSRWLHHTLGVYEDRLDIILGKGQVSWQMEYLVAGEREWAVDNFSAGKEELLAMDARLEEIRSMFKELDAEMPLVTEGLDEEEEKVIGACMRCMDGPLNVQRQVPRLQGSRENECPTSTAQQHIAALMGATNIGNEDGPAGGPPNAAGRDGRVKDVDRRVKERIPRQPCVADEEEEEEDETGEHKVGAAPILRSSPPTVVEAVKATPQRHAATVLPPIVSSKTSEDLPCTATID